MNDTLMRVRRLARWLPVIWRSRTWDYQYTLNILGYSLTELGECLERSRDKEAKRIRYVCALIRRIDEGVAWGMGAKDPDALENMYWNEIFDTIKRYGQRWWD